MSGPDGMMLWTSKIIADTQHLGPEPFGAWSRLRMSMWRNGGSLPNDEARLARIVGVTPKKWRQISGQVMELFTVDGDRVVDFELETELRKTTELIDKRRAAGSIGGQRKSLKNKEPALASATDLPEQTAEQKPIFATETQTQNKKVEEEEALSSSLRSEERVVPSEPEGTTIDQVLKPKKKGRRKIAYTPDFGEFWKGYPTDDNMSKEETFDVWKKLSDEERDLAIKSLASYRAYCQKNKDWYHPAHASKYLKKKRFEGHAQSGEAAAAAAQAMADLVFTAVESDQWKTWDSYQKAIGKVGAPQTDCRPDGPHGRIVRGWNFKGEWPPEPEGKVFVAEGTPEWSAWKAFSERDGALWPRKCRVSGEVRLGDWFKTKSPPAEVIPIRKAA